MLSVTDVRKDFPILSRSVNGKPLVYLDNAATTLKPKPVLDALMDYYSNTTANVHRGIHFLSVQATDKYEGARKKIAQFLGADEHEVVFTSGTTESINLVALGYAKQHLKAGDRIVCTEMDNHSNMVPWQMLAKQNDLDLVYIPVLDDGTLDMSKAKELINEKTKLVVGNYVSNASGIINPIHELTALAHKAGAKISIDAAQAVLHFKIDVKKMNCDFLSFSSHKLLGPTGFGVLYAKKDILEEMQPIYGGGDMIDRVSLEGFTLNDIPFRFESGTPHIAGAIATAAAIDYVEKIGFDFIEKQEQELRQYLEPRLADIPQIKIMGQAENKIPIFAFTVEGLHGTDIASILDQEGVAVRSGHHCTMPLLARFNYNSLARASFSFYNTKEEADTFINSIKKAVDFLG